MRRLRPNIVIGGVDGVAERDWPGSQLRIGGAIIQLDSLRSRCHMTTIDPDTLQVNPDVLRDIVRRFGNKLALNAEIARSGLIRVGDPVSLVSTARSPRPSLAATLDRTRSVPFERHPDRTR